MLSKSLSLIIKQSCALFLAAFMMVGPVAYALPNGATVTHGNVTFDSSIASQLLINQTSGKAIINWNGFSISANELAQFIQPDSGSAVLNRVTGGSASNLLGQLSANGQVFLINPNGILIGAGSRIDTAGFVASTLDLPDIEFINGGTMRFLGDSDASVINRGEINVLGGDVLLIARTVENSGTISAPQGTAAMASGTEVWYVQTGDVNVFVKAGSYDSQTDAAVENAGLIEGARVDLLAATGNMYAYAINNEGTVRATGIDTSSGKILIVADTGSFTNSGTIEATRGADGGDISIKADWLSAGDITATGTTQGGSVTLDADQLILGGTIDASASNGQGGYVTMTSTSGSQEISSSLINVSGNTGGKISHVSNGSILTSGSYDASGRAGKGGEVDLTAENLSLLSTIINTSGTTGGGLVRIGGAYQGGKEQTESNAQTIGFVERWGDLDPLANATTTFLNETASVNVSSSDDAGGTVIIWAEEQTTMAGAIDARGATQGG